MAKDVTGVPPKLTAVAPVKFVPVIVIFTLPAAEPTLGDTDVTVGNVEL
jgi:hypothetical protein